MSKQNAIKELQEKISQYQSMLEKAEKYIPDDLPQIASIWITDDDLRIDIPYNLELLQVILEILGPGWKLVRSFWSERNAWELRTYQHNDNVSLVIALMADREGSACQIIESVKEVPIYEVICN